MVVFGDSAAYRVVVEPGCLGALVFCARASGGRYLGEAVFFIPSEALVGVFACEFADESAMAVVEVPLVFKHPHQVVAYIATLRQGCAALHCLLGGVVLDVAGGVVAEGLVGGLRQLVLRTADGAQCSVLGLQDAPGGVVVMAAVTLQAVPTGTQFTHFVVAPGFEQAVGVAGPGAGGRGCELLQGLLPSGGARVFGAEGLADLAAGLAPRAGQAAYGVVGGVSAWVGFLKNGGFRQDWRYLVLQIYIGAFFPDGTWR